MIEKCGKGIAGAIALALSTIADVASSSAIAADTTAPDRSVAKG